MGHSPGSPHNCSPINGLQTIPETDAMMVSRAPSSCTWSRTGRKSLAAAVMANGRWRAAPIRQLCGQRAASAWTSRYGGGTPVWVGQRRAPGSIRLDPLSPGCDVWLLRRRSGQGMGRLFHKSWRAWFTSTKVLRSRGYQRKSGRDVDWPTVVAPAEAARSATSVGVPRGLGAGRVGRPRAGPVWCNGVAEG